MRWHHRIVVALGEWFRPSARDRELNEELQFHFERQVQANLDAGMQLGCGHPMGPLTLCDFIGLDVLYAVCNSLYEEFKRDEYAPPPLMKRMVAAGRLGRKTGRGFYDYAPQPQLARV